MTNDYDLFFSGEGLLSRALFRTSATTLTIFVEDADKEYEYEEIFERLLPKEISVDCILPTGGKTKLEEAFALFGSSSEYGRTFFIADGDFDVVLGKSMIEADNFIYLKRYNIESYLLSENAVLRFMRPRLKKTIQETKSIVKYEEWLDTLSPFFNKLFALHCVFQKYAAEIENVGRNPAQFLTANGFPNESRFEAYRQEIQPLIPNVSAEINTMLKELTDTYGTDTSAFVCGKYYIYALKSFLNAKLKKKINEDEVKAFSITWINTANLQYINDKLSTYLSSI